MDHEPASVRGFRSGDLDNLYRICLLTADNGQDGSHLFHDPRLPGEVYAAAYAVFEPSLAFVAEDQIGVGGYIVATLDSVRFEQRLEQDWWPALRERYPEPSLDMADSLSRQERTALRGIHRPWTTVAELAERFPSQLHISLLPRMQSRGLGRQLMMTLVTTLRAQGSPGLHFWVGSGNQRAAGFYQHLGFTKMPADGAHLFRMDLTEMPV